MRLAADFPACLAIWQNYPVPILPGTGKLFLSPATIIYYFFQLLANMKKNYMFIIYP